MKKTILSLAVAVLAMAVTAQEKYFEGSIVYQVNTRSKVPYISDSDVQKILWGGPQRVISFKKGKIRNVTAYAELITLPAEKRVYYKFPKWDTLYYADYTSDVVLAGSISKIDTLFMEGGGVHAGMVQQQENDYAVETDSCVRIEKKRIGDHFFGLPSLPRKKLSETRLSVPPGYPGGMEALVQYMGYSFDQRLIYEYADPAQGDSATFIRFKIQVMINGNGEGTDIKMLNPDEVEPHLAAEALRLIKEVPRWIPVNVCGQTIPFPMVLDVSLPVLKY